MSYVHAIGIKTLLKSLKNTFLTIWIYPATSGRFRPHIASTKIQKITKNHKKFDFLRIDILEYSGWKYDIWPEIGPLGPGKHPETLYWPSNLIWIHFTKSQKNRIFHFKNHGKKFFEADFFGRCAPAAKSILGIDTPYWCPQSPIILLYELRPFLLKSGT